MAKLIPPKIKAEEESLSSRFRAAFGGHKNESLSSQFHAAFGGHVALRLSKKTKDFQAAKKKFMEEVEAALYVFVQQPLIAAFGAWVDKMQGHDPKIVDYCDELFQTWILPVDSDVTFVTLLDVPSLDHGKIINGIRNQRDKPLELRENLVSTYISFINWLSEITFNCIEPIVDPDYQKSYGRVVDYTIFIKLLDCLDEKSQLVAKLLYFGGTRTLEEVLDVEIGDIDFKKDLINYRSQLVWYPQHIVEDIKILIGSRKSGRVFLGRQNAPLNPSTIFRSFKEAGSQVGLGNSFSAKMLTINK